MLGVFRNEIETATVFPSAGLKVNDIAREQSIQSSTIEWAEEHATPLVRDMLAALKAVSDRHVCPPDYHWVLDVRVQRLMPGMYASIPGWHCDGVPRCDYHAQPNLEAFNRKVKHFVLTRSTGDVTNTEFLTRLVSCGIYPNEPVWRQVHRIVEHRRRMESHDYPSLLVPDGEVVTFGQDCLHRATPVRTRGWRIFMRLSQMITPPLELGFAPQQQVYVLSEENGW